MKTIVASEEPAARSWVRMALGPDWTVVEASNGLEVGPLVAEHRPELLVCDETMESYGAFGLCRDLKILPEPPAVVILLERAQDAWLARWAGADRWLVRPIEPFALAEAAREAVAGRGKPSIEEESA